MTDLAPLEAYLMSSINTAGLPEEGREDYVAPRLEPLISRPTRGGKAHDTSGLPCVLVAEKLPVRNEKDRSPGSRERVRDKLRVAALASLQRRGAAGGDEHGVAEDGYRRVGRGG